MAKVKLDKIDLAEIKMANGEQISTPMYPPLNKSKPAWNKITGITARALRPSISGRYFKKNSQIYILVNEFK